MCVHRLIKNALLGIIFLFLMLQITSAASWFFGSIENESNPSAHKLGCELPLDITHEQLHQSLAQFTIDGIVTSQDIAGFIQSATRGAQIVYQLYFTDKNPNNVSRKEQMRGIVDLTSFFYLIAMIERRDGIIPADVTFGIVDVDCKCQRYLYSYLDRIANQKHLPLGNEDSLFGTNKFAYLRQQSHGFTHAWGCNLYHNKNQPTMPLLFVERWSDIDALSRITGPLYHLLIGLDQHMPNKLYLKPEECGIYYWGEWFGHAKGYLKVIGRQTILIRNLFDGDDEPQFNKERLPRIVLSNFKKAARAHGRKHLKIPEKEAIRGGLSSMYLYAIKNGWDDFYSFVDRHYQLPHLRRGNEIIICPETAIWSIYFSIEDPKLHHLLDSMVNVKRAIFSKNPTQLNSALKRWRQANMAAHVEKNIKNIWIRNYFERLAKRFDRLLGMHETALQKLIDQYGAQLFG